MLSWPRNSSTFVDSEGLLPHKQKPTTGPYPGQSIISINPFHQVLTVMCSATISMTCGMSELFPQRIIGVDIFVITLKVLINSINMSKKVSYESIHYD